MVLWLCFGEKWAGLCPKCNARMLFQDDFPSLVAGRNFSGVLKYFSQCSRYSTGMGPVDIIDRYIVQRLHIMFIMSSKE
jgi:hypothetical protein